MKLLAVDIDGTLCSRGRPPSGRSIDALSQLRGRGWEIVLCTGRRWDRTAPIVAAAGLGGAHVIEDGATIVNAHGETLRGTVIPASAAVRLVRTAAEHGVTLVLGGVGTLATSVKNDDVRFLMSHGDPEPWYPTDGVHTFAATNPISVAYLVDPSDDLRFSRLLQDLEHDDDLAVRRSVPGMASVVAAGVSKASAMAALLEEKSQDVILVAIGDGPNDIPLFAMATFCFAMGGSSDLVRSSATYVTQTIDNDGAAQVMEHLLALS